MHVARTTNAVILYRTGRLIHVLLLESQADFILVYNIDGRVLELALLLVVLTFIWNGLLLAA